MHSLATASSVIKTDLVAANRILANEGILDGFGHVSVRHDKEPDLFLIARSMAPGLVRKADLMVCDLEGTPKDPQGRRAYLERFIHSAIYSARPDVQAIVHSHSQSVVPFSASRTRLRPICHMSGFLGAGAPVFEIRNALPDPSDLLIRTAQLGDSLAATLGSAAVALMRGHGSVAVGGSIKQAVFRAYYADMNARLQAAAMALGDVEFLSTEEAELTAAANDQHLDRPWELWLERLQATA